ncbi:MAG: hypothetical protein ACT4P6_22140 [Gemmatimonadaceae bacterium]
MRDECLNVRRFLSLDDARGKLAAARLQPAPSTQRFGTPDTEELCVNVRTNRT